MTEQIHLTDKDSTVSVIIPALNEEDHIAGCITAARGAYSQEDVEILVADGGSRDQTLSRIPQDCTVFQTAAGRALQMNTAAQHASGSVLVFCHADSRLPEGWREAIINILSQPGVSGGTFQTRMEPAWGILKWRNHWTMPPDWRFMYGDQCQFMRRSTFKAIGGFPEIPLMEDVEMSRALHAQGRLVRIDLRAVTSSRRLLEKGILRQTVGNFWRMLRYLYFNATPEQIAQTYRSSREQTQ